MSQNIQFAKLEILWWLLTAVITMVVLSPIWLDFRDYPFWWQNVMFIVLFITFTRYIFLLKHTFIGKSFWIKLIFLCIVVPVVFLISQEINLFQAYLDEYSLEPLLEYLPTERKHGLIKYVRSEMILFGVGAVIAAIILAFRFVVSIWRQWNKGTV